MSAAWELIAAPLGHSRMAPAVRAELAALHRRHTGGTDEQADAWLRSLEASGRYQQDVFA